MTPRYRIARWIGHQHWMRGRGRLASLLCPAGRVTGKEFDVEFFGNRYHGQLDDFIDRCVYLFGGWELHILALLSQLAATYREGGRPVTYVDVGANTGQHSLLMARRAAQVICFEPFEPARRHLHERISDNQLRNVTVVPVALGPRRAMSEYYPPEGRNQGTGSLMADFCPRNQTSPLEVPVEAGDSYFQSRDQQVDVMKIDVEGAERGVLEGLHETLRRYRPAVVLELSEYTQKDIGTIECLRDLLYPGAALFTIGHASRRAGYKLQECDFSAPSDILAIPNELQTRIPRTASFAAIPGRGPECDLALSATPRPVDSI